MSVSLNIIIFKDIKVNGLTFPALFDSGSDTSQYITITRWDVSLKGVHLIYEKVNLKCAGNIQLETDGYFKIAFNIDNIDVEVKFYVVKDFAYPA